MTRHELEAAHAELNIELAQRQRLGGYSTDSAVLELLTKFLTMSYRHHIAVDKEIAKLKRGVTSVRPKKK